MREQLWNQRRLTYRHLHDLRNLNEWRAWTAQPALDPRALEDDTTPEEALLRHEATTFANARAWFENHAQEADYEVSRLAGARWAEAHWPHPELDARLVLTALLDSPLAGRHPRSTFLVQRARPQEVQVLWDARAVLAGQPVSPALESHGVAWIEGFVNKMRAGGRLRREEGALLVW
jgi:hypothetical protein